MLWASVTGTSPLQVKVDGASTAVAASRLGAYTATVNDRVLCARVGTRLVVLGKVV